MEIKRIMYLISSHISILTNHSIKNQIRSYLGLSTIELFIMVNLIRFYISRDKIGALSQGELSHKKTNVKISFHHHYQITCHIHNSIWQGSISSSGVKCHCK